MVLSVNEVPDGSADSMFEDISQELQKLRDTAHALRLPNADKINWTLTASSSSDSASTQKRFNKLLEQERGKDEEKFGDVCPEGFELVEIVCSMHLGVKLRKAFLDGIRCLACTDSASKDHHPSFMNSVSFLVMVCLSMVLVSNHLTRIRCATTRFVPKLGWTDRLGVDILFLPQMLE